MDVKIEFYMILYHLSFSTYFIQYRQQYMQAHGMHIPYIYYELHDLNN